MSFLEDFSNNWMGNSEYKPEEAKIDTTRGDEERALGAQSRGQQLQLGNYYQNQMAGKGPSVAQQQLYAGRDAAIAAAQAQAASGRGTNAALAQRTAVQQAAGLTQQASQGSAMLRAQEQAQAAKQYGDLVQAQRMQDLLARGYSVEEAKAQLAYQGQFEAAKMGAASQEAERNQKGAGGIFTAAGDILSSDERTKQDIEPVGTGLRPSPARTSYIENQGPPGITTGGGMTTLQMNNPGGDYYGVGDFSAEQPTSSQPGLPAGPSFLQRIGYGLMGLGSVGTGNNDAAAQAIKDQQMEAAAKAQQAEDTSSAPTSESSKPEEKKSGLGAGAVKALVALSDENSKKEIQNLRAENSLLKGAMAPAMSGAQRATAQSPSLQTPAQYEAGAQAFNRLDKSNKPMADLVFQTTVPPAEMKTNRADVHKAAASDYALRMEQFRKAYADKQQDLKAMEQAAAIEQGRVPTPSAAYPPGTMSPDEMRAQRAQMQLSDVNSKQVMSDVSAKEPYPSDERMKQDLSPLLTAIKSRGKEMSGSPATGSTASYNGPASGATASYPPLTQQAAEIPAVTFRYKEGMGEDTSKRYTGTTAQALEKIPATAPAVINGPDGLKRVDAGQLTMTNTAMISDLARQVEEFKKRLGMKEEDAVKAANGPKNPKGGKATDQDIINSIRALKSQMPQPSAQPFEQRTGEIVRQNPYEQSASQYVQAPVQAPTPEEMEAMREYQHQMSRYVPSDVRMKRAY